MLQFFYKIEGDLFYEQSFQKSDCIYSCSATGKGVVSDVLAEIQMNHKKENDICYSSQINRRIAVDKTER